MAALGYDAPKKDINAAFKALDDSGDGLIEYGELKAALSKHSKKGKGQPAPSKGKKKGKGSSAAKAIAGRGSSLAMGLVAEH